MSHLSILPTVFRSIDHLEASLKDEGLHVNRPGFIVGFDQQRHEVDLVAITSDGHQLGWKMSVDGTYSLFSDLHCLSTHDRLVSRLRGITRRYALRKALNDFDKSFNTNHVKLILGRG